MELVEGKTLRELCASDPLPVRRAIGIAVQIAEGLAKAHAAGIVHRDLKPENVMVSKDGYLKILTSAWPSSWSPNRASSRPVPTLARPETHPGTVMGTVVYMSPEQASGQPLDFRSDQFSFGSILYEMTSGQKAFTRKTAAETHVGHHPRGARASGQAPARCSAAPALVRRALPRQGPGRALRLDARPRARACGRTGPSLRGRSPGRSHHGSSAAPSPASLARADGRCAADCSRVRRVLSRPARPARSRPLPSEG